MKVLVYEIVFKVTRILQTGKDKGKEWTSYKTVYTKTFDEVNAPIQIEKAAAALEKEGYFNIRHTNIRKNEYIFID